MGGRVRKGPLKGAIMYGLTLEERATCDPNCGVRDICYGNHMPYAARHVYNADLLERIDTQLTQLCSIHKSILVRLHVLGDFPDVGYVTWWYRALERYASLHLYGYTHWPPQSEIGDAIQCQLNAHPTGKARILQSLDQKSVFELPSLGGYALVVKDWADTPRHWVRCPAELTQHAVTCADCALCFTGEQNVAFIDDD